MAVFYSLCALIEALLPTQFMAFMNALFHGMDFRPLASVELHPWVDYGYALLSLSVWAFAMGAFFAGVHNALKWARGRIHFQ